MTTTRAVIYARISSDDGSALGVARQVEDCHELAEKLQWDVVKVFTDNDVSAYRSRERPEFSAALAFLRTGRANALLVWDLDRLTRRSLELNEFIVESQAMGWALASVGGDVDLATPQGKLVAKIKGDVAEHEAEQASRRLRRKFDERAQRGLPHGFTPYGWKRSVDGHWEVDTDAQAVIDSAAKQVLSGLSLRSVVARLNHDRTPAPRGGRWSSTQLRQVLLRTSNAGLRVHRAKELGARAPITQGVWPALIDETTFYRLQALLKDSARRTSPPGPEPRYLLSGIATCGLCGTKLRTNRPKGSTLAYVCPGCFGVSRRAHIADRVVEQTITQRLEQPDAIQVLADDDNSDQMRLLNDLHETQTRLDEAAGSYVSGSLTLDVLQRVTPPLTERIAAIRDELEAVGTANRRSLVAAAGRWTELDVVSRRAVVDLLMAVSVHPRSDTSSDLIEGVRITWRQVT